MSAALLRLEEIVDRAQPGLHDVGPAGEPLPNWPRSVLAVYTLWNGARFFGETIELWPADQVVEENGRYAFGIWDADPLWFDDRGRIWRYEEHLDTAVWDGASLDRWLLGALDATELLFDGEGEYFENAFDEHGEIAISVREQMARAQKKRDHDVPGPWWRLGQILREQGRHDDALGAFEQAVRADATFSWGWLDLALTSELLGRLTEAVDEAVTGAELERDVPAHFWAHVARLALAAGQADVRTRAAKAVESTDPTWVTQQVANVEALLADEDDASASTLLACLGAVAPRNMQVMDLKKRVGK